MNRHEHVRPPGPGLPHPLRQRHEDIDAASHFHLEPAGAHHQVTQVRHEQQHQFRFGVVAVLGPGIEPGSISRTTVSGVDILPTIADIVGAEMDLGDIDGGSFKDILHRQSGEVARPWPFLVFHDKDGRPKSTGDRADSETALLQGDFKLIKTWKDGAEHSIELYNLAKDKEEQFNLTASMPEKTTMLGKLMDDYITEVGGDVTIITD